MYDGVFVPLTNPESTWTVSMKHCVCYEIYVQIVCYDVYGIDIYAIYGLFISISFSTSKVL